MRIRDWVDDIVVMTLDKRLLAGEAAILLDLISRKEDPSAFLVGDGEMFPVKEWYGHIDEEAQPRRQAYNYGRAFLKVIKSSQGRGIKRLFYLEDDAQLVPQFDNLFPCAVSQLRVHAGEDWDLFFVGGNHMNGPVQQVLSHLIKPHYSLDLHALIIHERAFPKLLAIEASSHRTIDGVIGDMQKRGDLTVYAASPCLAIQRPGFSYNEGRFDDKTSHYLV